MEKRLSLAGTAAALLLAAGAVPAMADDLAGEGLLAAGALTSGQYAQAVRQLKAVPPRAMEDPARLINLGNAYAGMGKLDDAKSAYRSAERAPDMLVALADGSEASSRDVARRALGRIEPSFAMR